LTTTTEKRPFVLEAKDISKSFGAVQALRGVDLSVRPSEVVGLVGDNGAGKTTLVRCIAGIHQPDVGEIYIDGRLEEHLTPESARLLGVETVHQNLSLVETFDVMENFFLNRELYGGGSLRKWLGWLDKRAMYRETNEIVAKLGLSIGARDVVANLSGGQRQIVAVARAVTWGRHIVIMDEPAAALGVRQTGMVLEFVRLLASRGAAVLFISHNIQHVLQVTDRIVVLRHGAKVADVPSTSASAQDIVSFITGAVEPGGGPDLQGVVGRLSDTDQ
jgi:ABC-type sugar transport system ATPase subunit